MPKEEWGVKRLCPKCGKRFYDLQNDPMTCPSCGAEFDLASLLDTGNKTVSAKAKAKADAKPDAVVDDVVVDDAEVVLDDADDALVADDSLLDDDDDDTVALEEIADVPASDDES